MDSFELIGDWDTILRILVVGPLAYLAMIVLLRASGKRTLSKMNAFDFIVTVALGSLLATIILDSDIALFEGVVAMGILIIGQFVVTWLSVRSDRIERAVKAEPTLILRDGQALPSALRRVRLTERDVEAAARRAGAETSEVSQMIMEPDGTVSVVVHDPVSET